MTIKKMAIVNWLRKRKLKKIINHYGIINQIEKTKEELFELLFEINNLHYLDNLDLVFDKLADVEIMLEQLNIFFGGNSLMCSRKINKIKKYKIERTLKLMESKP